MKPQASEYPVYYDNYIRNVKQEKVLEALQAARTEALALLRSIPDSRGHQAYAEGKWSICELVLHCADAERVFAYRALCFARGEAQTLPAFEENDYAANSRANARPLSAITAELEAVGAATLALYASFSEEVLAASGQTPAGRSTVNAIGFTIAGHLLHHLNILRERYLK